MVRVVTSKIEFIRRKKYQLREKKFKHFQMKLRKKKIYFDGKVKKQNDYGTRFAM